MSKIMAKQCHLPALLISASCWLMLPALEQVDHQQSVKCESDSFILLDSIHHNNLGGKGPHTGAEGIVYVAEEHHNGTVRRIHVVMNAITPYDPWNIWANGMLGNFGMFNQNPGSAVTIRFTFTDPQGNHIKLQRFTVSVYDMDSGNDSTGVEEVVADDYHQSFSTENTTVQHRFDADGKEVFFAGVSGDYDDNPVHFIHQSQRALDKCIAFAFQDAQSVTMTFRSTPGATPRFTQFSALNALKCNMKEGFATYPYPPRLVHPPTPPIRIISPGEKIHYSLREDMFQSNSGGLLILIATQEDDSSLPSWLKFNSKKRLFTGVWPKHRHEDVIVKISAHDTVNGQSSSTNLIFKVNQTIGPIVVNPMPEQIVKPGSAISFDVPKEMFLGSELSLSVQQSDGSPLPDWLVFDPHSRTFSGRAPKAHIKNLEVRVVATDDNQQKADDLFPIIVLGGKEENQQPRVVRPIPSRLVEPGSAVSFDVPKGTFQGNNLILKAQMSDGSPLPDWLIFDPHSWAFSGEVPKAHAKNLEVRLVATDDTQQRTDDLFSIIVLVSEAKDSHRLMLVRPMTSKHLEPDDDISFTVPKDTFLGSNLILKAETSDGSPLPDWLIFDSHSWTFSGKVPKKHATNLDVRLIATDDKQNQAHDLFSIVVLGGKDKHRPIVVNHPMPSKFVEPATAISFTVPKETFLGNVLSLSAQKVDGSPLPDWLIFDSHSWTFSGKVPKRYATNFEVRLVATDDRQQQTDELFSIVVLGGHPPRTVKPMTSTLVEPGSEISIHVPKETFQGNSLVLKAQMCDGTPLPDWLILDPHSWTFSGRVPSVGQAQQLEVCLVATDAKQQQAYDRFSIVVMGAKENHPPTASSISLQRAQVGERFSYEAPKDLFIDADDDGLTWKVEALGQETNLGWLQYNAETREFFGVPMPDDVGAKSIKVCATDTYTNSVCTTLTVLVESPVCPTVAKALEHAHTMVGHSFSFTVPLDTFKSPSRASLKLRASSVDGSQLPKWLNFDSAQSKFSGMPGPEDCGDVVIKLAVTDLACDFVSNMFAIHISETPQKNALNLVMLWWLLPFLLLCIFVCGLRMSGARTGVGFTVAYKTGSGVLSANRTSSLSNTPSNSNETLLAPP